MSVVLRWHGLTDLRRDLAALPVDLRDHATPITVSHATDAAAIMRQRYPRRTGRLANSVVVRPARLRGPAAVTVRVTNTAPYAHFFEYGTRYMAPGRVFIPTLNQKSRVAAADVAATVLPAYNFRVKGHAAD